MTENPRLKVSTILPTPGGPDGFVVYGPDDDIPEEHARQIGAHAWEGGVHPFEATDKDGDGQSDREAGTEPPRGGAGSGRDAWVAFAHEIGHGDLVAGKSRDEIVQALIDAGAIAAPSEA